MLRMTSITTSLLLTSVLAFAPAAYGAASMADSADTNRGPAAAENEGSEQAQAKTANGVITSVDSENNQFTLRLPGRSADRGQGDENRSDEGNENRQAQQLTLQVNDETQYIVNGQKASQDQALSEGAHARVTYKDNVAMKVHILGQSQQQ